jgi:hypothetical protein
LNSSSCETERTEIRDPGREEMVLTCRDGLRGVMFAEFSRVIVISPSSSISSDCRDFGRPKVSRLDEDGVRGGAGRYRSE